MSKIGTVGELLNSGTGLGVHCLDCPRYAEIDLQPVADIHGREYQIVGADTPFRRSLRCSVCGSRKIQMTIIAPGTRGHGVSRD